MLSITELESKLGALLRRAGLKQVGPQGLRAALVCLVVLGCLGVWRWWPSEDAVGTAAVEEWGTSEPVTAPEPSAASSATIFVHVVGAVRRPSVYELPVGSRVKDAVESAGGVLPDAVTSAVNMARVLSDGEQLLVPDEDEVAAGQQPPGAMSGGVAAAQGNAVVDINTADAAALDSLPGIGPSTAAKIIAERETNGRFACVEDLSRVSGIGEKKLAQLEGLVCVK